MNTIPFALAAVSEPAPAGRSSAAGIAIILVCLAAAVVLAARAAVRHFKGQGGCCGDAAPPPPAPDKQIGPVVMRLRMELSGLHCMNCVGRVKKALDALPGVAADVTLDPQVALVSADRQVSDDDLRNAVEALDFKVVSIS